MIYRCIHKDIKLGFSVYRANRGGDLLHDDLLLVATLPGSGCREIAMHLEDPEPILYVHYTDCFPDLVDDFRASWEAPRYRSRLVSIRRQDLDTIECITEPTASPNGGPTERSGSADVEGGPPSVS